MSDRFSEAVAYASSLHRRQRRKGNGTPYIAHLLAVASLVIEAGGTEEECIAALLHDAVEDQGGAATAAAIRRRFGDRVADIVDACSEPRSRGWTWSRRKAHAVRRAASADPSTLLVLSADKLHNARSLAAECRRSGDGVWERFRGGRDGTIWYFRSMADSIAKAGGSPLLGELRRAVGELEQLAGETGGS